MDKGANKNLFNKWFWGKWISTCKRMNLGLCLTPHIERYLKWVLDLNVRANTIKLLQEVIGVNLCDHGLGNAFLDISPKAQMNKRKKKSKHWTLSELKTYVLQTHRQESEKATHRMGNNTCKSNI